MVDYRELNKVVSFLHAMISLVSDIMDCLSHELGTHHYVLVPANAFFSIAIPPEGQD